MPLQLTGKSTRARALLAVSWCRQALVLATDSVWVALEVEDIAADPVDLGMVDAEIYQHAPGLYLWEGALRSVLKGPPDNQDWEPEYMGDFRPVTFEELPDLLTMEPGPDAPAEDAPNLLEPPCQDTDNTKSS